MTITRNANTLQEAHNHIEFAILASGHAEEYPAERVSAMLDDILLNGSVTVEGETIVLLSNSDDDADNRPERKRVRRPELVRSREIGDMLASYANDMLQTIPQDILDAMGRDAQQAMIHRLMGLLGEGLRKGDWCLCGAESQGAGATCMCRE